MTKRTPLLIVLVGLPGTGKTTFRQALIERGVGFMTISSDDYIDFAAKLVRKTYSEVFQDAVGPAKAAIESDAKQAKQLNVNV